MINTKKILSITHEQGIDGLFSGAILKNAFPKTLVFLTNYGHENMNRIANIIKFNASRSSGTIVVSDMAINNDLDVKLMEEAAMESRSYVWDFLVGLSCMERRN